MPRYFFRIENDFTTHNRDGTEFPNKREALGEATIMLGKLLEGIDGKMSTSKDVKIVVEDEFREELFEIIARAKDLKKLR